MKNPRLSMPLMSAIAALPLVMVAPAVTAPPASATQEAFYSYTGAAPLASFEPGTVLATRNLAYRISGIEAPVEVVQLLYRTTDAQYRPSVDVTSVLLPPVGGDPGKAVAYQSYYDSLNPEDSPSRSIAGQVSFGGTVFTSETGTIAALLAQGYTVIVADTEGQRADFAAGPEYGMTTLDSIRAATRSSATRLSAATRIGLAGYSGGALATNWAAALAPGYAPEINARLIGAAEGGVLVNPARNLGYVDGSVSWAGIAVMAIIGIGRSYDLDFTPYLSDYGRQLVADLDDASIGNVLFQHPGLTWRQLVKTEYADPNTVAPLTSVADRINLGTAPTPTIPMFIGQGANGELEGTPGDKPGIGPGDGVMVAGDVRTLARQYCDTGNRAVEYRQYDTLAHGTAQAEWTPQALAWLNDRFAGTAAPTSCGAIAPGNLLTTRL
ncbi:lipase family protein [Nocardia xishanensis]|uniref:Lipase family protein n=1 Tax=Nocardia xishanensis TaxID=238964 RepID=A0ABW7WU44_9NOCA